MLFRSGRRILEFRRQRLKVHQFGRSEEHFNRLGTEVVVRTNWQMKVSCLQNLFQEEFLFLSDCCYGYWTLWERHNLVCFLWYAEWIAVMPLSFGLQ